MHETYQRTMERYASAKAQLDQLKRAQADNREYVELYRLAEKLQMEKEAIKREQKEKMQLDSELTTQILNSEEKLEGKTKELEEADKAFREYEITAYPVVQKAIEAYTKSIRISIAGGLMQPQSRKRAEQRIDKAKEDLIKLQSTYQAHYPGKRPGRGNGESGAVCRQKRPDLDGQSAGDPSETGGSDAPL